MAYKIDKNLEAGQKLLVDGKKVDSALKLINKSARKGETKGKSFFEIGEILRKGVPGLEPSIEESKKYYDEAISHFFRETCDSMDNRELGDYFNYGFGSEPANKKRALQYYDIAAQEEDDQGRLAKERGDEIRRQLQNPSGTPVLPSEKKKAVVSDEAKEEANVEEKTEAVAPAAPVTGEAPSIEPKTVVERRVIYVEEKKPEIQSKTVVVAKPVLNPDAFATKAPTMDEDQLLIQAIRLMDNPASSLQDKMDGVELAKASSEEGSMRASVLMGFLYEGNNSLVEKDYSEAKKYYDLAISRGSASGEYRLGRLYLNPKSGFEDDEKGHQLILDSARRGYSYALNYLGDCFREKVVDPRNLEVAYRYYSLAGERGLGISFHNMAEIDASRQENGLAKQHEQYASENGYDPEKGDQNPLAASLHL